VSENGSGRNDGVYIRPFKEEEEKKKKQMQTVALRVARIDCEGCERKIKHVLSGVKGKENQF